ncbi:MAG: hypothetical protein AAGE61_00260 [Pseudomonadota bacterium]
MGATLVADSFVSIAAIAGLLILRLSIKRSSRMPWIAQRYSFAISVLVAMLASRVFFWTTGYAHFVVINVIAAALIPLAMLILCEGLMRRHAHHLLKIGIVAGVAVFILFAPFAPLFDGPIPWQGLLAFQIVSIILIGVWVIGRDRSDLTTAENRIIDRLAWSLLLIIPFAITDFRSALIDSPARLSGVAILFLCWLSLSVDRLRTNTFHILGNFALIAVSVCVAVSAISFLADLSFTQSVQAAAIILCTGLLLQVFTEARSLQREGERATLLSYIANSSPQSHIEFLTGLQDHPLVSGALILEEADLDDFGAGLKTHLKTKRILRAGDRTDLKEELLDEELAWLFERYGATHAMLASEDPLRIVLLSLPSIANAPGAELELAVVQRLSHIMSKAEAV